MIFGLFENKQARAFREERIVEKNNGMKKIYPSTISLLYPIVAMIYIATKTSEVSVTIGYGLSQLGYVMFFAGVYKGTFLVFNLDKRLQVLVVAVVCVGMGFIFINAK